MYGKVISRRSGLGTQTLDRGIAILIKAATGKRPGPDLLKHYDWRGRCSISNGQAPWIAPKTADSLRGKPASISVNPSASTRKAFYIPLETTCTPLITRFTANSRRIRRVLQCSGSSSVKVSRVGYQPWGRITDRYGLEFLHPNQTKDEFYTNVADTCLRLQSRTRWSSKRTYLESKRQSYGQSHEYAR
jgi:hypothetical protein